MFKLLSSVALFALLAVAFAEDAEKSDQSADELFFTTYGYYPTASKRFAYGYNNVAGYQAAAYPAGYPVAYQASAFPAGYGYQAAAFPAGYAYQAAAYPAGYQAAYPAVYQTAYPTAYQAAYPAGYQAAYPAGYQAFPAGYPVVAAPAKA